MPEGVILEVLLTIVDVNDSCHAITKDQRNCTRWQLKSSTTERAKEEKPEGCSYIRKEVDRKD